MLQCTGCWYSSYEHQSVCHLKVFVSKLEATVCLRQQPKKFHVTILCRTSVLLSSVSRTCLVHSSQCCPLDMSGLQLPVLLLDMSGDWSTAVSAAPGHVWSTAACAAPWTCLVYSSQYCPLDMSDLQQPVLPPGHVWSTAACAVPWTCLIYSSQCCPLDMSGLQQPVLPLDVPALYYFFRFMFFHIPVLLRLFIAV
jgi:hypothetical protein